MLNEDTLLKEVKDVFYRSKEADDAIGRRFIELKIKVLDAQARGKYVCITNQFDAERGSFICATETDIFTKDYGNLIHFRCPVCGFECAKTKKGMENDKIEAKEELERLGINKNVF